MESAQTVVQMVLPHTRIDLSKSNYDAVLSILDVFSGEYPIFNFLIFGFSFFVFKSFFFFFHSFVLMNTIQEVSASKPIKGQQESYSHVTRTTQLALVVFITHGSWTFRESPPLPPQRSSPTLSSVAPPATRAHELDFDGFKLVHVVQNVEFSEKR